MFHRIAMLACLSALAVESSSATPTFSLYFTNDASGQFTAYYPALSNNILAAANNWAQYFPTSNNVSILIEVQFMDSATFLSSGFSVTSHFVTTTNGTNIYEQGAGAQIRTGGPSGSTPDIRFEIGTNYLVNTLWFDPNPTVRSDPVPANKTDSMSVCIHELCHAFAFNGWMNGTNGSLPGYESTFDQWVRFNGTNFYFYGPRAQSVYGRPVPITYGDPFHVGNNPPRPGSDLIGDLMNGVVFTNGTRYYISGLDLAMMADTGLPIVSPPVTLLAKSKTNSMFQLNVSAPVGRNIRIDVSGTLTNWTALTNFFTTNTTMTATDPSATNSAAFYRARLY